MMLLPRYLVSLTVTTFSMLYYFLYTSGFFTDSWKLAGREQLVVIPLVLQREVCSFICPRISLLMLYCCRPLVLFSSCVWVLLFYRVVWAVRLLNWLNHS